MHPLLARQLKRLGLDTATIPHHSTLAATTGAGEPELCESEQGFDSGASIALSQERCRHSMSSCAARPRADLRKSGTSCKPCSGLSATGSVSSTRTEYLPTEFEAQTLCACTK